MSKSTVLTIVGVVVAVLIAWFIVDVLLKLAFVLVKVALIAVVALVVFFALRYFLGRRA